ARLTAREAEGHRRLAEEIALRGGLYEAMPGPVFTLDRDGRLSAWNSKVLEATGLKEAAGAGRPAGASIQRDDRARSQASIERVLSGGETRVTPGRLLRAEAEAVPYLWSGAPVRSADGAILGAVGFGQNITEERRAAEA